MKQDDGIVTVRGNPRYLTHAIAPLNKQSVHVEDRRRMSALERALLDLYQGSSVQNAVDNFNAPAIQHSPTTDTMLSGMDRMNVAMGNAPAGALRDRATYEKGAYDTAGNLMGQGGGNSKMTPIEAYIRQAAQKRGYDPEAVMRIVMNEGGVQEGALRSRGHDPAVGGQEQSYGPFQMNMHAGLGKRLLQEKGIDVRDPNNVYAGIDYALNRAGVEGWTPWLNTQNKLGYSKWTGLRQGAEALPVANPLSPGAQDFVLNNPQPGGFGPNVPDPNSPLFGSMSPGGGGNAAPGMMAQNNDIPMGVVNHWDSLDQPKKQGPLSKAGAGFTDAMSEIKPARIAPMPAPSGDVANGLMKLMQNPQALAQLLMKQRLG